MVDFIKIWEDNIGDSGKSPTCEELKRFGLLVLLEYSIARQKQYDRAIKDYYETGMSEEDVKEFGMLSEHYMYSSFAIEKEIYGDD